MIELTQGTITMTVEDLIDALAQAAEMEVFGGNDVADVIINNIALGAVPSALSSEKREVTISWRINVTHHSAIRDALR